MKPTAIIPAYNEASTIEGVIKPLVASPYVGEVIVVSDGSTDATVCKAKEAGATVVEQAQQQGKGTAMLLGLKQTQAPIVAFFDADLIGLTAEHIEQLILPVTSGSRMMNVGLRDKGPLGTLIAKHLPLIGGERVMLRQVIEGIDPKFLQGYMVESALNYFCRSKGYAYGAVILRGLSMRRKYEKVGYVRGVIQYLKMFFQIGKAMIVVRIARIRGVF
jgi:polyisoprenyl-phosphate glycosyltransferase